MNIIVNTHDRFSILTSHEVPAGYIVIQTKNGFHYISEDSVFFLPIEEALKMVEKDVVRKLFGKEE